MKKKHIVAIGHQYFAFDSLTAATQLISILAKSTRVERNWDVEKGRHFPQWEVSKRDEEMEFTLTVEQAVKMPVKVPPKEKKSGVLRLPKPKRGAIQCVCEQAYISPGETCFHCGRDFDASHSRTHH